MRSATRSTQSTNLLLGSTTDKRMVNEEQSPALLLGTDQLGPARRGGGGVSPFLHHSNHSNSMMLHDRNITSDSGVKMPQY